MGAPQSGADIYRDGKKMRAAPKERHIRNGRGMGLGCRRAAQLVADGYGETQGYGGNGGDGA